MMMDDVFHGEAASPPVDLYSYDGCLMELMEKGLVKIGV
jgi:hypothetical protein